MSADRRSGGSASQQQLRRDLGLRLALVLEEFADRCEAGRVAECTPGRLADFVAGRRAAPFEVLSRIARHTGVSLDWLATGELPVSRAARHAASDAEPRPAARPAAQRAPRVQPEVLSLVIRMVLEAIDDESLDLYSVAIAELISLVYVAVSEAQTQAESGRSDAVQVARENLRRLLPQVQAGQTR